ncbi:ATP-binding protein [Bradyrhizobium sp. BR 10261]|uniref:ATP-binding protein n=1 Tax=Bradyrhizobium sp. BR 10261 TaxID=2749992 RepID=UPI001C6496AB|nr:ATP-binding protein [Bradyrhizobium sp. BR 10261]MBW7964143.1 sensor histidine kinase [Bradyrhizobium sp. BR 10261]
MTSINIKRAIENIRSGTTVYTPVIELIVNAIQAIREVKPTGGLVNVTILRHIQDDMIDKIASVDGFIVRDDGIGFTEEHRNSFDTLYTALKAGDGGKGFGRFTCLKYFSRFTVESVFADGRTLKRRSFAMGQGNDIIIDEKVTDVANAETGSAVTISGAQGVKFPDKSLDVIARVLVEKLLPYFIDPNSECPQIVLGDDQGGGPVVLNDYLGQANRQIVELPVQKHELRIKSLDKEEAFTVRVFKFYAPRANKSKISLVAHRREVTDVTLQTYIPEFADEFYDKTDDVENARDRNYIIKAYVFGEYLDRNVSLERGAFSFGKESDLVFGISQSQIEAQAATFAQEAVGREISARRERKQARITEYINDEAPWHRGLSRETDFSTLSMKPTPQEIELHLQAAKFQMETRVRAEVRQILESKDTEDLRERVTEIVGRISQTSKNDLIHYVSMRKCVLELFEKSLQLGEDGKYRSEGDVHDIVMPRKKDTDQIDYDQHNLWILDERLNFTEYVASDKPLDERNGDRTDLSIFGKRVAFRGDNEASNPITIFEFKKPQRHDFVNPSSDEDPIEQIVRYVNDIRDGKYKTPYGRDILVSLNTPFYGYVVCDFPQKVKNWLEREKDFTVMPDGLGYFRWYGNIKLYIEVLSWTKVQRDAEMRNKVFFHKLGI